MRKDRFAVRGDRRYVANHTKLFALRPALHRRVCDQRHNKDKRAIAVLRRDFPDAEIRLEKSLDCMVAPSLKAQLLGYRLFDAAGSIQTAHVGGFSHIRASKFESKDAKRTEMWVRRLRLNHRVRGTFRELGWGEFLDPAYEERLAALEAYVESQPNLRALSTSLGPSLDEVHFERLYDQLVPS